MDEKTSMTDVTDMSVNMQFSKVTNTIESEVQHFNMINSTFPISFEDFNFEVTK
jgi:hypothetical protein